MLYTASVPMFTFLATSCLLLPIWSAYCQVLPKTFKLTKYCSQCHLLWCFLAPNISNSGSSNPVKYNTLLYLASSVGTINIFYSAVSVMISLDMHHWWVPAPHCYFGGRTETIACKWHPQDGDAKKEKDLISWGPPRKERPWEVCMEIRSVALSWFYWNGILGQPWLQTSSSSESGKTADLSWLTAVSHAISITLSINKEV